MLTFGDDLIPGWSGSHESLVHTTHFHFYRTLWLFIYPVHCSATLTRRDVLQPQPQPGAYPQQVPGYPPPAGYPAAGYQAAVAAAAYAGYAGAGRPGYPGQPAYLFQRPGLPPVSTATIAMPPPPKGALPPVPPGAVVEKKTSVYVGKIPLGVKDETIKTLLEKCGTVVSWKRVEDVETKQPKGFGFCEYEKAEYVMRALRLLNGLFLGHTALLLKACLVLRPRAVHRAHARAHIGINSHSAARSSCSLRDCSL
jgi:hypothetical protein